MKDPFNQDPVAAAAQRPAFFDTPGVDQLTHMVVALAEEIAVLNERLENQQALLQQKGLMERSELDDYLPDNEESQARLAQHRAMVARLLQVIDPDQT